ncbi:isocitrate dehydrogenase [Mycobacterium antarcticum]|uniref:NADP-dependent isocitrate dehydrogenase n=1 Tax=Mycolicibacterium sp. TUM20983 TaxID=3023369 RepID=UPI00239F1DCA|nr:NADP-dependent isocitrate dehydrogenase [Mycolicibacterium sp. TUM20983]GLP76614.1 isocitrate dehydrogenase [Mycolicibacterium sp. TUM20983]
MTTHTVASDQPTKVPAPPRTPVPVTVAHGDGIGPEIMAATLRILRAAGASLAIEEVQIGQAVYERGHTAGIEPLSWESLRRTRVFLKAPITTPQGGGFKSLNVTVRKTLGLYANVRPCVAYAPFVPTRHPGMDVVIIRENEEDLYGGIEHRQTDEVTQCLKLISRPGCERICRYAFDYARRHGRTKVTCLTKDNIMKLTDGLFHHVFDEVAADYPDLTAEHWIVDIGAAKLADTPEDFDIVVVPNLYGDILSDVAAQLAGSVGMAGSANIGDEVAMFEAIHGSAPRRAGHDVANPSGLLQAAVMMLVHIGQGDVAARVHNAWLAALETGAATYDIARPGQAALGTNPFTDAVIAHLGQRPHQLPPVDYPVTEPTPAPARPTRARAVKTLDGVDVFLHAALIRPDDLADAVRVAAGDSWLQLQMITNRGVKVWPDGYPETFCTDHWRARFQAPRPGAASHRHILQLLHRLDTAGLDFIKTEGLYRFDGDPGYSLGQGQ